MADRARRRAITALGLDAVWAATFVVAVPQHVVAAAIAAVVLALGGAAIRKPRLGYALIPLRVLAAFFMLVAAATAPVLLVGSVAVGWAALRGFTAARLSVAPARPHGKRARARRPRSQRFDEIGSALIHLAFVTFVVVGILWDGRVLAAVGFVAWWICLTWGIVAVHEAGHALAALQTESEVPDVHIGVGLTLFRVGRVSFGAIPFLGHAHWVPNESTMTSRREALVVLAGPAANLLVAAVLLAVPFTRADDFLLLIAVSNVITALLNLIPFDGVVNGKHVRSDGARASRLLRPAT